jgi:hypothetical protein
MRKHQFNRIALAVYYSFTAMGIVFFVAGRGLTETRSNANNGFNRTFEQLSIGTFAPFTEPVKQQIPPQAQAALGGVKEIDCQAGQSPATCVPLGFFDTTFGVGSLTPQSAARLAGKPFLTGGEKLSEATPWLGEITVGEALKKLPGLATVIPRNAFTNVSRGLMLNPSLQNQKLGAVVDLTQVKVSQVPQIANMPFKSFEGFAGLKTNQIPGLGKISVAKLPTFAYNLPGTFVAATTDRVFAGEKNDHMTMSGTTESPVPCPNKCSGIEIKNLVGVPGLPSYNGGIINSGDGFDVSGGHGLLGAVNGGKEPTGVPFAGMKFVVRNVNPRQGSAQVYANFRFCGDFVGCTPYWLGIPLWGVDERHNGLPIFTTAGIRRVVKVPGT